MQLAVAILDTDSTATVGKSMEKRKEIPDPPPNAAPRADVERVQARVRALGIEWKDAVEAANLSRSTRYRLEDGEASLSSLKKVEEWVVREELRQKKPAMPTLAEQDERLQEWNRIGAELAEVDPQQFAAVLEGMRDVLAAAKLTQNAFRKIFRATPDQAR